MADATVGQEISPGIYEYGSLGGFKSDQGWTHIASYDKSIFGTSLFEVDYDEPFSADVQYLHTDLVMYRGDDRRYESQIIDESLSRLGTYFEEDDVALSALTVLRDRESARIAAWRDARNNRMADIIVSHREKLHILAAYNEPYRDNGRIYGLFGKLWGITVDSNAVPKPVVVGKDNKPAVIKSRWPYIELYYGKVE